MNQAKEYKNDKVSVQLTQEPGCIVKLEVAVSPTVSSSSHQEAMKRVRKEVSIPGFRKGKAPDALLLKHYASVIEREWRDCLLQSAFDESIHLTGVFPVKSAAKSLKSTVKEVKSPGDSAVVLFQFEAEPIVPSIDPSELQIPQENQHKVTEEEIDEYIDQTRLMFAKWEEVTGRPAEAEDYVRLDIDRIHGDHTHQEYSNKRFKITSKSMSRWLRELVIGLSIDEKREGISAPEEALDTEVDEEIKATFKPTPYRVTLKGIEKPELPAVDEEFVKKLGSHSLDDVKEKVRQQLQRDADAKAREKLAEKLENLLLVKYTFDLPKTVLDHEVKTLREIKMRQLKESNDLTDQELAQEMPQLLRKAALEAQKNLALFYIFRNYNHQKGLTVSKEEMNEELSYMLRHVPKEHIQEVVKSLDENVYRMILTTLIRSKGLNHLLDQLVEKA